MCSCPRGQSEIVGVVLFTAVIVVLVSVSGLFVVSGFAADPPPRVDIEAEATTQNVTLWHSGGDSVRTANTEIVLRASSSDRYPLETFTQLLGGDRRRFEAGDEWYRSHGIDADRMEILIVHEPSNEVVDKMRVDVEQTLAARFAYSPSKPTTADTISFDGTESVAADGTIDSYEWEFGDDGTVRTGETVAYSYDDAGEYDVNLTVTSEDGRTATRTRTVVVSNPSPTATFTIDPQSGDRKIEFDASASTAGEAGGTIENYIWDFDDGTTDTTTAAVTDHTYAADDIYRVTLTVEDENGATATTGTFVPVNDYFAVSNLVAPDSAQQDERITVNATVENTGTEQRSQSVEYRFDGSTEKSKQVELGYEESTTVSFDYTIPASQPTGTYTHGVFSENESDTQEITVEESGGNGGDAGQVSYVSATADGASGGNSFNFDINPGGETVTLQNASIDTSEIGGVRDKLKNIKIDGSDRRINNKDYSSDGSPEPLSNPSFSGSTSVEFRTFSAGGNDKLPDGTYTLESTEPTSGEYLTVTLGFDDGTQKTLYFSRG